MRLLCFDISSGGISAVLFNSRLEPTRFTEIQWEPASAATLPAGTVAAQFKQIIRRLNIGRAESIDAVCIGSFMHNCVLLDAADEPLTPVFTWLDQRGENGIEYVRSRIGDAFHERTGCRFHPLFPIFKLAAIHLSDAQLLQRTMRVVSIKAFLVHRLAGTWVEDHGMASASGFFNIAEGDWDSELLSILKLNRSNVPPVRSRTEIVGRVTTEGAREFALAEGVPVINGSGDGFLANVGSGCEDPTRISVTLGTSAVARQTLPRPVFDSFSGTFCYKADEDTYLLGCAGSNGGNILDWGRRIFGTLGYAEASADPPIFIPLLHGERSPEWDPQLTGSWHRLTARHTAADLSRSILEGVLFNLAYFVEIIRNTSREKTSDLVLSGNGFLDPLAAPILAAVLGTPVWIPADPGLASLRGAGVCSLRALGETVPSLNPARVKPVSDSTALLKRYIEFKLLRRSVSPEGRNST